jgi:acyl-CoA oxidase
MFLQSVDMFSTDEQREEWMPKVLSHNILGCYAQTELGHGSNVAGLETTATFDMEKDEFVIHTPNLTSTKWWPGEMGRYSNFALVMAKLVIDGNEYGIAPFLVQIRDLKTHKWMPGVQSGDLGPKFGYHSKDNGWLQLNKVRIPRSQMLQRFMTVSREGEFSINGDLRVLYSTMVMIRSLIVCNAKLPLMLTLTIALRYSAVRRQFRNISGQKEETQLLDYQTQ